MLNNNRQSDGGVALLIDFENLVRGVERGGGELDCRALMGQAREYGRVCVANAYADWRMEDTAPHQERLLRAGIEPVNVLARRSGALVRNAVDVRMAADAVDLAWSMPDLDVYVLATGDGDFIPVVHALKRRGKTVIGVGPRGGASGDLAAMCDRFVKCGPGNLLRGLTRRARDGSCTVRRAVSRVLGDRRRKLKSLGYEAAAPRRRARVTRVFEAVRDLDGDGPFTVRDIQDRLDGSTELSRTDVARCARLLHQGGALVAADGGPYARFRERPLVLAADAASADAFVLAHEAALVARLAHGGHRVEVDAAVAAALLGLDPKSPDDLAYAARVLEHARTRLAGMVRYAAARLAPERRAAGTGMAGWDWVRWVGEGLKSGSLAVNADGGWLHRIGDEVFVVVPDGFEEYAAIQGVGARTVKNWVVKLGRHRMRSSGVGMADLFRAELGDGRSASGMLFPGDLLWGGDAPPDGPGRLVSSRR